MKPTVRIRDFQNRWRMRDVESWWGVWRRVTIKVIYRSRSSEGPRVPPDIGTNEQHRTFVGNRVSGIGLVVRDALGVTGRWRSFVEILRSLRRGFISIIYRSWTSIGTGRVEVVKWGSLRSRGIEELKNYES